MKVPALTLTYLSSVLWRWSVVPSHLPTKSRKNYVGAPKKSLQGFIFPYKNVAGAKNSLAAFCVLYYLKLKIWCQAALTDTSFFFPPIFHNQLSATVLYSTFEQVFSFVQFLSYRISYGTTYLAATSNAEKRRCTTQFKPTFSCNTASLYKRRNWSRFWRTIENVTDKEAYWHWSACWHEDARNDEGASQMLSVDNSFQYLTIIVSPILDITHENAASLSKRPTWRMCVSFLFLNLPPEARAAAWN